MTVGTVETVASGAVGRLVTGRLSIRTRGPGLTEVTAAVGRFVRESGIGTGVALLFCRHTSASLLIGENAAPEVGGDLLAWLDRAAPRDAAYAHRDEGPDDMPAHIRSMLTGASVAVPILAGQLALGTWQGLFLLEHRDRPHRRELLCTLLG